MRVNESNCEKSESKCYLIAKEIRDILYNGKIRYMGSRQCQKHRAAFLMSENRR